MVTSFIIILVGIELIRNSIKQIINPETTVYTMISIIIMFASILIKFWMMHFYNTLGKRIESEALFAAAADSRNDVITTSIVLLSIIVAHFTGYELDAWAGLIVSLFIIWGGIGLIKDTMSPLLGEAPDSELVDYIKTTIESREGIFGTHDLIIHDYGPGRKFASVHVEMDSRLDSLKSHDIIDSLERFFMEKEKINLIIHYDPIIIGDKNIEEAYQYSVRAVKSINEQFLIHDFRMAELSTHIDYTFDIVVPSNYNVNTSQLQEEIQKTVQHGDKPIYVIITVDQNYLSKRP